MFNSDGTPTRMAVAVPCSPKPPSKRIEGGRLVDGSRKTAPDKLGNFVDSIDAISAHLNSIVQKKAFKLRSVFRTGKIENPYEGQVGFVRFKNADGRSCLPVTALHNIATDDNETFVGARVRIDGHYGLLKFTTAGTKMSDLPKLNLLGVSAMAGTWQGVDITWGNEFKAVASDHATSFAVNQSFERVRDDFQYCIGQTIGIAIYSDVGALPENVGGKNRTAAQLELIYGKPDQLCTYTGKILHVGEHHIEYNLNSFEGCSGAIVFLLDQKQSNSVRKGDFGRAIAVHAGAHPMMLRNVGFKISAKPIEMRQS